MHIRKALKKKLLIKIYCIIILFSNDILALTKENHLFRDSSNIGVSISSGYGTSDIVPIRVGLLKYWDRVWREGKSWQTKGYWEASFYHMNGKKGVAANSNDSLQAVALAGAFRFEQVEDFSGKAIFPYLDLGIGVSYLTKKEIGGRDLGTHFQFEDRLGFGIRFGKQKQYELGYRAIHFSNAYLADKNHGINLQTLVFTYWF